jgi:hypothetical protein
MATDICFPLVKFSYATGTRPNKSIPWAHLQADNLFVIVKGRDAYLPNGQPVLDSELHMRVLKGNEDLVCHPGAHIWLLDPY